MLDKNVFKFWFQIPQKMAYIGTSENAKKKYSKKYQKHEIVCNLWQIDRPKQFIL